MVTGQRRRKRLTVADLPGASRAPTHAPSESFKSMVGRVEQDTRPTSAVVAELRETASYTPPPLVRLKIIGIGLLLGLIVAALILWGPPLYEALIEPVLRQVF